MLATLGFNTEGNMLPGIESLSIPGNMLPADVESNMMLPVVYVGLYMYLITNQVPLYSEYGITMNIFKLLLLF